MLLVVSLSFSLSHSLVSKRFKSPSTPSLCLYLSQSPHALPLFYVISLSLSLLFVSILHSKRIHGDEMVLMMVIESMRAENNVLKTKS